MNDVEIEKLEHMSKFKLSPAERKNFAGEFDKFYSEVLVKLDNVKVDGDFFQNVIRLSDLREDTVKPSLSIQDTQLNTKNIDGRFFTVPLVME